MQGNRGRDTKAELAVRRLGHARGLRYRVNARPERDLRRTVDLLFTRARVAVFMPATNPEYWEGKIGRNRRRDIETTSLLQERSWTVMRFWEHETPASVAGSITEAVRSRREATG